LSRNLLYLLLFFSCQAKAQQVFNFNLLSAGVQPFDHCYFVYGMREASQGATLHVFKLDENLRIVDSTSQQLSKIKIPEILRLSSDTLHHYLSIHIQKKGETVVRVFRCKSSLQEKNIIENIEVQRLNNSAMFSSEPFYFRNKAYAIRQTSDSGIKQFYLDKYSLISETGNYDYKSDWQWAFEKKDMEAARVILADDQFVYLFAWRVTEPLPSQWLLKIETKSGVLKRAIKLNSKIEDAYYQFGTCFQDVQKNFYLSGQKLLRNKDGQPLCDNKDPLLYLFEIDSLAEIRSKEQFTITLPKRPGTQKCNFNLIRFWSFTKEGPAEIRGEADVFSKEAAANCFVFNNTFTFSILKNDDGNQFKSSPMVNQPALLNLINPGDKLDLNGKICNVGNTHSLFTAPLIAPVKIKFAQDSLQNQMWILNKTDARKKTRQFNILRAMKGQYQLQSLESFKMEQSAELFILPGKKFFITSTTSEGKLQIKLYNW